MKRKGICLVGLALIFAIPAMGLEKRLVLYPTPTPSSDQARTGTPRTIGSWSMEGAIMREGLRGGLDIQLGHAAYVANQGTDLLFHFDGGKKKDETGNWSITPSSSFFIDTSRAYLGEGAGNFRLSAPKPGGISEGGLNLEPGALSLFSSGSRFRDFSLEFWLYPASADNGEVILLWRSSRLTGGRAQAQAISCVIMGGRLLWSFQNFFSPPENGKSGQSTFDLQLRGRSQLIPRSWSHHLIRFDGDSGLLEYMVDGKPEDVAYASFDGHEGGSVLEPAIGDAAPIRFCPEYSGLADELRISRFFVENPNLKAFGKEAALALSPVADLGFGHSRLTRIDAEVRAPGNSSIEFSYRIAENWASWKADSPAWTPFRPGQGLPPAAVGRYVQLRAELYPDGTGRHTPTLSSITLSFEQDSLPPPPARLLVVSHDGAIELRWSRVPESDLAGYLVYYGDAPGEYFGTGAVQGPSPIDAGNSTSIILKGLPNGRLLYFAVASYDAAAISAAGGSPSRAGEFSPEISARPSRTAP